MGTAFKCDLCDVLQEGVPDQTIAVEPKHGGSTRKQLCTLCNVSFNDWMGSRAPADERPGVG